MGSLGVSQTAGRPDRGNDVGPRKEELSGQASLRLPHHGFALITYLASGMDSGMSMMKKLKKDCTCG